MEDMLPSAGVPLDIFNRLRGAVSVDSVLLGRTISDGSPVSGASLLSLTGVLIIDGLPTPTKDVVVDFAGMLLVDAIIFFFCNVWLPFFCPAARDGTGTNLVAFAFSFGTIDCPAVPGLGLALVCLGCNLVFGVVAGLAAKFIVFITLVEGWPIDSFLGGAVVAVVCGIVFVES